MRRGARTFCICWLFITTWFYAHLSTHYFGSTWFPSEPAEVITDGIVALLVAISMSTIAIVVSIHLAVERICKALGESESPESGDEG